MGKRIQKILLREIGKEVLNLGYAGENEHTEITINCVEVYADYPDATVQMVVKPPVGDQYLAVVTYTAGLLEWDISASDVAASGSGSYQLIFEDGGVEIFRSAIGKTQIMASIDGTTGDAPTPQKKWAEALAEELAEQIAVAAEAVTPVIVVNCGTISSLPVTLNADGVTEDYTLIGYEIGTPTIMTSKLTVETGDGIVTLSGTKNTGSTTIKLKLIKATRVVDAEEVLD